jgi:hypothetical protein
MQDIKNFYFAWIASMPFLVAIGTQTLLTAISAIILPLVCFALGKTADILVQIYLHNRQKHDR